MGKVVCMERVVCGREREGGVYGKGGCRVVCMGREGRVVCVGRVGGWCV